MDPDEIEPKETANQYEIVRAAAREIDNATQFLSQLVMNGMADGWEPTGGIAVHLGVDAEGDPRWTVFQAMVRYRG